MRIAEIFYSIQGEGKLTGVPSVFIRTSGCNLRCGWCDTPYASWHPEGALMTEMEILAAAAVHPTSHVVLTGGEPMIAPGVASLAAQLKARGHHVTIETAATVAPQGIACDLASLSPKLGHSTPSTAVAGELWAARHERNRLNLSVLRAWIGNYAFQLKFVVRAAADVAEIQSLLNELSVRVPPENVLLMPEGTTEISLRERAGWLVDICKQTGYRFCPRVQVALFGHTRGT